MTLRKLALSLLVLIAALTAATQWRASVREAAAREAYPPEGQFVEVGGRRVHAVVSGEGPDLVLIHGSSGNTRDFTMTLAGRLAESYRVIVFDRPGLGWSDRLPRGAEGIAEQAAHLRAAAQSLGAERPLVLGQSYGGAVALAWALDHPDATSGLITVSGPSHPWDSDLPWLYKVNSSPLGSALAVPLITAFVPQSYVADSTEEVFAPQPMPEGYMRSIGAGLSLTRSALRANAMHRRTLKAEIAAMAPRYDTLTVPFEIVHGTADTIVGLSIHAEPMLEDAVTANLTRLEGIGHMPHHVAQTPVTEAINRAATRAGLR